MGNPRSGLSAEQRSALRNEFAGSIKNNRQMTNSGLRISENNSGHDSRNSSTQLDSYNDRLNDREKLKGFASKYETTRRIYLEMSNGYAGMQGRLRYLQASKKNAGTKFLLAIVGCIVGCVAGGSIAVFLNELGVSSDFCALLVLFGLGMGFVTPIEAYNKSLDKKIRTIENQLQEIIDKYSNVLKNAYESTNKAVSFSYASPFIIDKLLEYMDNGRCDTIKECLNLYEQEKMQYEQMQWLRHIGKETTYANLAIQYLAFDTWIKNVLS